MFSNRIANSAKFLQMPVEAQLLYFHMILRADDDGIVEAYPLMKLLGSAPDVFKVLLAKGFLRQLNEDQVVVITDWLEHNVIRADRKVNSIYLHLLKENAPDIEIVQPKPRSDVEDNSQRLGGPSTDGLSKVKSSQDKLNKPSEDKPRIPVKDKFETDKYPKENYTEVLNAYQRIKEVKLQGDEFLPPMREIKFMFKSGRTPQQITEAMGVCEDNYEDWSMNTVRMKIADVVAGKLTSKSTTKNKGIVVTRRVIS